MKEMDFDIVSFYYVFVGAIFGSVMNF